MAVKKIVTEKIPKDLAKAYRDSDYTSRTFSSVRDSSYRDYTIDYNNAHYETITPEEAIAIRKSGDITKLRVIVAGQLVTFYPDGTQKDYAQKSYNPLYVSKKGTAKYSSKQVPFADLMRLADKIYVTDEKDTPIPANKLARRDDAEERGHNLNLGARRDDMERDWAKRDMERANKYLRQYRADLQKLEIDWKAGNISPNEYNKRKTALQQSISRAQSQYYKGKDKYSRDRVNALNFASNRAATMNVKRFKELKSELRYAQNDYEKSQEKLSDLQSQGVESEKYAYARKRIKELQAQIASAQRMIASYEQDLSADSVNADTQDAMDTVEKNLQKIRDIQNEFNRIMRRESNESFDVKGYGKLTINEG